jgi:hypothetical protein
MITPASGPRHRRRGGRRSARRRSLAVRVGPAAARQARCAPGPSPRSQILRNSRSARAAESDLHAASRWRHVFPPGGSRINRGVEEASTAKRARIGHCEIGAVRASRRIGGVPIESPFGDIAGKIGLPPPAIPQRLRADRKQIRYCTSSHSVTETIAIVVTGMRRIEGVCCIRRV